MIILRMKIQDGAAHTERESWWSRATSPTISSSPRWGSLVIIAIVIIITIIIVIFICVLHAYPLGITQSYTIFTMSVLLSSKISELQRLEHKASKYYQYCEIVKIRWASRSRMSLKRTVASWPGHQSPPRPPRRQVVLSTGEHDDNDFEFYENI